MEGQVILKPVVTSKILNCKLQIGAHHLNCNDFYQTDYYESNEYDDTTYSYSENYQEYNYYTDLIPPMKINNMPTSLNNFTKIFYRYRIKPNWQILEQIIPYLNIDKSPEFRWSESEHQLRKSNIPLRPPSYVNSKNLYYINDATGKYKFLIDTGRTSKIRSL